MLQANLTPYKPWRGGPGESIRAYLYSHHTSDFNELYEKDGNFRDFAKQVYHYFDYMPVGERLNLDYDQHTLEWVLLTFVAFYEEGYHSLEFYLSDDYTQIIHEGISPSTREIAIRFIKQKHSANTTVPEESEILCENLQPAA